MEWEEKWAGALISEAEKRQAAQKSALSTRRSSGTKREDMAGRGAAHGGSGRKRACMAAHAAAPPKAATVLRQ